VFVEIAAPAIIVLEQQLCRSGNIHGAESTGRQGTGKGHRRQPAHVADVLILCVCQRGGGACGTGVDVRLGLKDGRGSNAAVLAPQVRYVHQGKNGIDKALCGPEGQSEYAFNHQDSRDGNVRIMLRSSPG